MQALKKIFLLVPLGLLGQAPPCSFDSVAQKYLHSVKNAEQLISSHLAGAKAQQTFSAPVRVIPVVVHVIHNNGTENISDAQIQSQIDVLNEDFRKLPGTPGDGSGVDTEIEFCLAKLDPQGRCTNGIVRVQSALTNHQTYQRADLSNLSYWDATRYLNIYVVKTISGGTIGYASFPGGPNDQDGVVIEHTAFGTTGTVVAPSNKGRTATHEVGHWLGLYHTFNGGCGADTCADGDYVCDTPPAINPNFGCPSSVNSCSNDVPDVNDQVANYMDYTDDLCKSMFSSGQKNRMQATLTGIRTTIWTNANLVSTGCDSGYVSPPCNVVADFTSNGDTICLGNSVLFTNKSLNDPLTYQWYFPGGTPSASALANQSVTYNAIGTFPVKLVVTNANGTDSIEISNYITVINPVPGQTLPFSEGFEGTIFPPNGMSIENPDQGITWERDTIALAYLGLASARINNLININYGQSDALHLPPFDFTSFSGTPYLSFQWAYARSDANYSDELFVLVSKDCGLTWSTVFYRTGTSLATGPTQTTPYIPDSTTVWKNANISLNSFTSFSRVQIKIVNVTDGGNNLYIDNINLGPNLVGIPEEESDAGVSVFPNPAQGTFSVYFPGGLKKDLTVRISDITGKSLYMHNVKAGGSTMLLNFSPDIENGIYFVSLETEGKRITKKLAFSR